jgi:hypothetical protein
MDRYAIIGFRSNGETVGSHVSCFAKRLGWPFEIRAVSRGDKERPVSAALNPCAQRTEIHDLIILPKNSMTRRETRYRVELTSLREPSDPSTRVNRVGAAAVHLSGKRPEIGKNAILPSKPMANRAVGAIAGYRCVRRTWESASQSAWPSPPSTSPRGCFPGA